VIVVDNASIDDSVQRAAGALDDPRLRLIALSDNIGFAAANNRAIAMTAAPWVALLNPDAFPQGDWLAQLMAATRRHPDAVMFGSTQLNAQNPALLEGAGDQYLFSGLPWRGGYGAPAETLPAEGGVFTPCAAAALYRRDAFDAVGGFDESYFCYVEDVDLGFRLRLAGGHCIQVRDAVVHHVGGGSGGSNDFALFHGMRNLVWTFVKDMPGALFWLLLPVHAATLAALCLHALVRRRSPAVWHGVGAALAGLPAVWAARRRVQRARIASTRSIAQAVCWSPGRYFRRAAFTLPPDT
jgi:N-acetylglucosaminyl-diphospho-decaprenol L-rhamnosyltransferase